MTKLVRRALLAGFITFAYAGLAGAQAFPVTDAEFKCQQSVNKAGSKFVAAKAKCVSKCLTNAWKGVATFPECFPPYGGPTAECVNDTVLDTKGAEDKFRIAIRKACDPTFKVGTDCPECYSGGDCSESGEATDRVQNIEGQVDSFVPGVGCETAGADPDEQKCQLNTAKVLSKYVGGANKCYDKCFKNLRKGLVPTGACFPPVADVPTQDCLNKAANKAILGADKKCVDIGANPDCPGPDQYPSGAQWVNLVDLAIGGTLQTTYCGSPSGAFLESTSSIQSVPSHAIPSPRRRRAPGRGAAAPSFELAQGD
jgi:hypothetical protein